MADGRRRGGLGAGGTVESGDLLHVLWWEVLFGDLMDANSTQTLTMFGQPVRPLPPPSFFIPPSAVPLTLVLSQRPFPLGHPSPPCSHPPPSLLSSLSHSNRPSRCLANLPSNSHPSHQVFLVGLVPIQLVYLSLELNPPLRHLRPEDYSVNLNLSSLPREGVCLGA